MVRPRVLSADDHVLLLDAFERLLEADYEIVGTASDGRRLVQLALQLEPDAIVADMSMPELNGLEAARQVLARVPQTRVVLLTVHEDPALAADAFRAGVAGFLVKRSGACVAMTPASFTTIRSDGVTASVYTRCDGFTLSGGRCGRK